MIFFLLKKKDKKQTQGQTKEGEADKTRQQLLIDGQQ